MSWKQRNEYFCKAQTDMQMIYIEAEREVRQLNAENAKLRELASKCIDALCGNGISLDEYEELEGMAYSLRVDA